MATVYTIYIQYRRLSYLCQVAKIPVYPHSSAGYVVRLVAEGILQVAYDARILLEYREVLARPKFGFDPREVRYFLTQLEREGTLVTAPPLAASLPDPGDAPFFEVALAARCPLVTGNTKHYPPEVRAGVELFTPSTFVAFLAQGE